MITIPHIPSSLPLNVYNDPSPDLSYNPSDESHFAERPRQNRSPKQFCDACNSSCCLMNGKQKLQARYEGFLLVKRLQGPLSSYRHLIGETQESPGSIYGSPSSNGKCVVSRERSQSFGDLADCDIATSPMGPTPARSTSQFMTNGIAWDKLVNISKNDENHGDSDGPVLTPDEGERSSLAERILKQHCPLSRTKSRSQDNLMGKRVNKEQLTAPDEAIMLNNRMCPPREPMKHHLSRSEGSIHNVMALGIQEQSSAGGLGVLMAEVGELARIPKKLMEKFSDEVGHITFFLERWREEYVVLTNNAIAVKSSTNELVSIVPYSQIVDIQPLSNLNVSGHQNCLLVTSRKMSHLFQARTSYIRDQWFHTLIWKRNSHKYRSLLKSAKRPEVLLKELKNLVDMSLSTPLHDHSVCQAPLEVVSSILINGEDWMSRDMIEDIIVTLAPLLENNRPSAEICTFFSRHCCNNPRSRLIIDMFTPVVRRILKHNVDFCKYPYVRHFTQDYIQALNSQNDGLNVVHKFVRDIHGNRSTCPHLRVLPNLVSVCTAAICAILETQKNIMKSVNLFVDKSQNYLECFVSILGVICEYDDWRPGLAQLLQPIPFPDVAFTDELFVSEILPVIKKIGTDPRCEVHQTMLGIRDNKEGWIQIISPSSMSIPDMADIWVSILETLLSCCCRRKKFLRMLMKSLSSCLLLALRDNSTSQDILCLMLEWKLIEDEVQALQVISTLQCTDSGKKKYQMLYDRQFHLHEIQQKSGPLKLTVPSRSTDEDVKKLLSSGPFGNLQILSLAFTRVTSSCAEELIHLPALKYLDLWGTQFGDKGLQLISEHLHDLQSLNLCETPVTDVGIAALTGLKHLKKLNLNSTKVSLEMFEHLKKCLPKLEEIDVAYTDAW